MKKALKFISRAKPWLLWLVFLGTKQVLVWAGAATGEQAWQTALNTMIGFWLAVTVLDLFFNSTWRITIANENPQEKE